ncbi:DUF3005 domain-containing protein [Paraburkholderia sp. J12]|uniref:DUF3005 domain-containing protein n=1 Tax=Paraburkholderia sp. J12 TaxID=2805432 RepID=UPI002ABD8A1F|nr:DUF3005 domain-containing protein [Paraburkholderia sp. J12]
MATRKPAMVMGPSAGPDPLARASRRIMTVEMAGTVASGTSVDADGKTREAGRDASPLQDNVVKSNATPENHVPVPSVGLGGFDSRVVGALPAIGTRRGFHVQMRGYVSVPGYNGERRTELVFSIERGDE